MASSAPCLGMGDALPEEIPRPSTTVSINRSARTKQAVLRWLAHAIFRARAYDDRCLRRFAEGVRHQRILELGSGKPLRGRDTYSARRFFDASNEFIQSAIVVEYGHRVVDVTTMRFRSEFDVILCTSVLDHVYDFELANANIYERLSQGEPR